MPRSSRCTDTNPHKPGRPSHVLHTFWIGNLRLVLNAVLSSGKQHSSGYAKAAMGRLLDELGPSKVPALVCGDCGYGNENIIDVCEQRGLSYLLRKRHARAVEILLDQRLRAQQLRSRVWQNSSPKNGAPAGILRIVALGGDATAGRLRIDAYGQIGSPGPNGDDGIPWQPDEKPQAKIISNRPTWSFRPYKPAEIGTALGQIDDVLQRKNLSASERTKLLEAKHQIEACRAAGDGGKGEKCVALRCDEDKDAWERDARGEPGKAGRTGQLGKPGGDSGQAGMVYISTADKVIKDFFIWNDGTTPIDETPAPLEGAPGGLPGRTAAGGLGRRGAQADPLGACLVGQLGENGEQPPTPGIRASSGSRRTGQPATLQPFSLT
ncbi:DDE family transposase [Paraburkholderia sp. BL17N1]|nr:DDE family transposase [Paraburkholderia sp. BL17N1]